MYRRGWFIQTVLTIQLEMTMSAQKFDVKEVQPGRKMFSVLQPQEINLLNARHTMQVPVNCFSQPWQVVALHQVL